MSKPLLWFIANVSILIGGPILYHVYLDRLLDHEYATGIRTSTDGDIILIPVAGLFIFLLISLLIINAVVGFCVWLRRRRRPA